MHTVQRATHYFGITNLVIGITRSTGPLVTGTRDRLINIRPGLLYGIFGMNWLHALLHLVVGIIAGPVQRAPYSSIRYMRLNAVLFGFLSVKYVLRALVGSAFGLRPGPKP